MPDQDFLDLIKAKAENIKPKLLDLSRRNPLISTRLSPRSNAHIRVVDELPDVLFYNLTNGQGMRLIPLPDINEDPKDEDTKLFRDTLSNARITDETYQSELEAIDQDADDYLDRARQIERQLKDRVRDQLGMPERVAGKEINLAQHAKNNGITPSYELPELDEDDREDRHLDNDIQTLLLPKELERKLGNISSKCRTWLQETGINVLHVAFGFLEWSEPNQSGTSFAPIILCGAQMEKQRTPDGAEYYIAGLGDEPEANSVLAEKLRLEFNIEIPPFEGGSIEDYFRELAALAPKEITWRIRRQIAIGVFPSARMAMYHDIDTSHASFTESETIQSLLGGTNSDTAMPFAEEYEIDEPEIEQKVPCLVLDADSSQFSTLVDIASGKNLAVEGPPGTGKSQTIVNAIAAALADGKKVLFVAEKLAALDVVKSRLEAVGLGEFLLPLQAERSTREQVISSVRSRVELPHPSGVLGHKSKIEEFRETRAELSNYILLSTTRFGDSGFTIHEILSKGIAASPNLDAIPEEIRDAVSVADRYLSRTGIAELQKLGNDIAKAAVESEGAQLFWKGTQLADANIFNVEDACKLASSAAEQFSKWDEHNQELSTLGFCSSYNQQTLTELRDGLSQLQALGFSLRDKRPHLLLDQANRRIVQDYVELSDTTRSLEQTAQELFRVPCNETLLDDLRIVSSLCEANQIRDLDLTTLKSQLEKRSNGIGRAKVFLAQLKQLSGFDQTADQWKLDDLHRARSFIDVAGDEALIRRTHQNTGAAEAHGLRAVCAEGKALQATKAELSASINFDIDSPAQAVAEAVEALKTAGPFGFLSSRTRRAVRLSKAILKTPSSDRSATIELLEALLSYRRKEIEFEQSAQAKLLLGVYFRSVDTDFEPFERLAEYLGNIHKTLVSPNAQPLKRFLLTADTTQLALIPEVAPNLKADTPAALEEAIASAERRLSQNTEALNELRGLVTSFVNPSQITTDQLPKLIADLESLLNDRKTLQNSDAARNLLGSEFDGSETALASIRSLIDWAKASSTNAQALTSLLASADPERVDALIDECIGSIGLATQRLASLCSLTKMDAGHFTDGRTIAEIADFLRSASQDSEGLTKHSIMAAVLNDVAQTGCGALVDDCLAKGEADFLADRLAALAIRSLAKSVYATYGASLSKYSGRRLNELRAQLAAQDKKLIELGRKQLRAKVYADAKPPRGNGQGRKSTWTEMALIENEISKQKRFISLRDLTERAGTALQELKPCWMMSPLAVAQYVPKEAIEFDLCIIDEASQMRPEAALGALMRSKQIVVVGDTNQLPPSNFFKKLIEDDEADDDENVLDESILEMANGTFRPARRLRWHYRSRHSGLIKFSNRIVYDDNLIVFPSASEDMAHMGVEYKFVGGLYKSGTNAIEARAVVDAALQFMKEDPDRSLGIVTLNQKQRELIFEEFEDALNRDRIAAAYVEKWRTKNDGLEEFFIKNLENVQGDERDVIFIGTVYGPETKGGRVAHRFGPINGLAGKRRLNVLFSRAKQKIVTFSSMKAADITVEEGGNAGVYMLKRWLEYSATGMLDAGTQTDRQPDSDFEVFVMNQIKSMGYEPVPQVGVAGYFIDIGVRHPDWPHGYVLAVECDGASYHSSRSARDRDRLRQEVLEGLGWQFHRIWSTDWFSNPAREADRLREVLSIRMEELRAREAEFQHAKAEDESSTGETNVDESRESESTPTPGPLFTPPSPPPPPTTRSTAGVSVGDTVRVRYIDGDQSTIVITITRERGDVDNGLINMDAPLAGALLDAEEGDEVEVLNGAYMRRAVIEKISKARMESTH